jgi:hypothetical protein
MIQKNTKFKFSRDSSHCRDRKLVPTVQKIGKYWYFENYVRARKSFHCSESITFATHSDYINLFHIFPLLNRWEGPISVALHAPGTDFYKTINTIYYLRKCHKHSSKVRKFVTFHIYADDQFIPPNIPNNGHRDEKSFSCPHIPPYKNRSELDLERFKLKLPYPVNIGRNLARKQVQTHFLLSSEIDYFPSPDLIEEFLFLASENADLIINPRK